MSETTTRKAVVKTEDVQAVLNGVNAAVKTLNDKHQDTEFDKGGRKGGFAEYGEDDKVIRFFETKEAALQYYTALLEGMNIVLSALAAKETAETKPAPRKAAEKPAA